MSGTEEPLVVFLEEAFTPKEVPDFRAGTFVTIGHTNGSLEFRFYARDAEIIRTIADDRGISPAEVVHEMIKVQLDRLGF